MKVRYYIVENCYEFIDTLERELCQKGISYVRIDTEIHFLDQIIRFLDFDLDMDLIVKLYYSKLEPRLTNDITLFTDLNQNDYLDFIPQNNYLDFIPQNNTYQQYHTKFTHNNHTYQQLNKRMLKNQSNNVNQKLKRYKK